MAAHRYWRLLFTACPQNTNVSAASIQLLDAAGGPNLATDPAAAFASSTDTRGPYTPSAGIAGQPSFWSAADQSGMPQWWAYDFGAASPRDIIVAGFTARSDNPTAAGYYTATAFDVQWSDTNNGTDWTQAWHVDTSQWGSGETRAFAKPIPGHHRFWRINTTACAAGDYVSFQQVSMVAAPGGPNLLTGGAAIASSSYDSGHAPAQALRPEMGFPWIAAGGPPAWWGYDFGTANPALVGAVTMSCDPGATSRAPGTWTLDWSDNGTDWTPSATVTSAPWVAGSAQSFAPTAPHAPGQHRFWRLDITSASEKGFSGYFQVAELRLSTVAGGATVATGGVATASEESPGNAAVNAFDGNPGTFWSSGDGTNHDGEHQWLQYDFGAGAPQRIVEFAITARSDVNPTTAPGDFTLLWSDNGTDFTTAFSAAGEAFAGGQTKAYAIPPSTPLAPGQHRFWRILIRSTVQEGATYAYASTGIITLAASDGVNLATDPAQAFASAPDAGREARNAVAPSGDGMWQIGSGPHPGWWAYDFGPGHGAEIQRITMETGPSTAFSVQYPNAFDVQHSDTNNGADWVTAWSNSTVHQPAPNVTLSYHDPALDASPAPGQHRFWRILVRGTPDGTYVTCGAITMFGARGVNLATDIASAFASNGHAAAAGSITGQNGFWQTSGAQPNLGWWAYDLGQGAADSIRRLCLQAGPGSAYVPQAPTSFDVQFSDQGTNGTWTTAWSIDGAAAATAAGQVECYAAAAIKAVLGFRGYALVMA